MFQCSRCHKTCFIRRIEKDAGDYVARCSSCGAKNILKVARINRMLVPTIEIVGWRD
jgi:DNA-directed RNA polymerase subunit RPC12/RpoP